MPCDNETLVHAYLDGALDPAKALEVERHLETCIECAATLEQADTMRRLVRSEASYHRASPELAARVMGALDDETPRAARPPWYRNVWTGVSGGAVAGALAASLAFLAVLPPASEALVTDVTNAHLRSIASEHIIDVASTDRHTVKPWLATHADLSPPVGDFTREGFTLVGGRVDFVDGTRAAVTVYRHGQHVINVFAWTNYEGRLPEIATRNGYHIVFWRQGNLAFCAISDIALDDMLELSRLLKAATMPDGRE
jgi:anti-sigma factor RsiW